MFSTDFVSIVCEVDKNAFLAAKQIDKFAHKHPWRMAAFCAAVVAIATFKISNGMRRTQWNWENKLINFLTMIPEVKEELDKNIRELEEDVEKKLFENIRAEDCVKTMPTEPWSKEKILKRLQNVAGTARSGKNTGAYYIDNQELDELHLEIVKLSKRTNPLHVELSPLIRQLEVEVVKMCASLFKGGPEVVGNMTSGGTESIRLALYAARERARANGHGADWEIVMPGTAHPAFEKAANELGIKPIKVPVYPQNHPKAYQVRINKLKDAITSNTIMVVGSAVQFPHGIVDPIESISTVLEKVDPAGKIVFHVDACLGGFILPWMADAGYGEDLTTRFGFDVSRVTSISVDSHKYGYADKGSSVILFRNDNFRKDQIFVCRKWPGGIYATPTFAGSRPGKDIAATWATLVFLAKTGYVPLTQKIIKAAREIRTIIETSSVLQPYLEIMGDPKAMVIAFKSKNSSVVNIYDVKNEMSQKGWYLTALQDPPGIHICVTAVHANNSNFVNEFTRDLIQAVETVSQYSPERRGKSGDAVMYRTNTTFAKSIFIAVLARHYWKICSRVEPLTFKLQ